VKGKTRNITRIDNLVEEKNSQQNPSIQLLHIISLSFSETNKQTNKQHKSSGNLVKWVNGGVQSKQILNSFT
jgi:hypothetical protein